MSSLTVHLAQLSVNPYAHRYTISVPSTTRTDASTHARVPCHLFGGWMHWSNGFPHTVHGFHFRFFHPYSECSLPFPVRCTSCTNTQ